VNNILDNIYDGLYFTFGIVKVGNKTKGSIFGRILIASNILGNLTIIAGGLFIASISVFNPEFIFSVFSLVYISLFIYKCLLYVLIYICYGKDEKVAVIIKSTLLFNILFIMTLIGLMIYFASISAKKVKSDSKSYIPSSARSLFENDGSLTLYNSKVEIIGFSPRFTATVKNDSPYSLNNVIVQLLVLDPESETCDDKVIDTIKFEILKYDENKTLEKGSSRLISYSFGLNESNYPKGWKTCSSVLYGVISGFIPE